MPVLALVARGVHGADQLAERLSIDLHLLKRVLEPLQAQGVVEFDGRTCLLTERVLVSRRKRWLVVLITTPNGASIKFNIRDDPSKTGESVSE